jgi:hypothetical protein
MDSNLKKKFGFFFFFFFLSTKFKSNLRNGREKCYFFKIILINSYIIKGWFLLLYESHVTIY